MTNQQRNNVKHHSLRQNLNEDSLYELNFLLNRKYSNKHWSLKVWKLNCQKSVSHSNIDTTINNPQVYKNEDLPLIPHQTRQEIVIFNRCKAPTPLEKSQTPTKQNRSQSKWPTRTNLGDSMLGDIKESRIGPKGKVRSLPRCHHKTLVSIYRPPSTEKTSRVTAKWWLFLNCKTNQRRPVQASGTHSHSSTRMFCNYIITS